MPVIRWKQRTPILLLAPIIIALTLTGCESDDIMQYIKSTPLTTRIDAEIKAAPGVNPDSNGRPSPIVVRLYELRAIGMFEGADFFSLYESENEALGADLLGREELELQPGDTQMLKRITAKDTQYIGVVGAYRGLDEAQWRVTFKIRPERMNKINIEVGDRAITIQKR